MKKIIALLIFYPLLFTAQSPFIKLDSLKFHHIVRSFVQTTQIQYQENKRDTDWNVCRFINPNNEKDILTIVFERDHEGWNILKIHGSYDSLFKIWKDSFNRVADAKNIRQIGFATKGRTRFDKNKENEYWCISSL